MSEGQILTCNHAIAACDVAIPASLNKYPRAIGKKIQHGITQINIIWFQMQTYLSPFFQYQKTKPDHWP